MSIWQPFSQQFALRFGQTCLTSGYSLNSYTRLQMTHFIYICLPIGTLFLHNALTRTFSSIAKLWWRRWTYAKSDWWSDNSRDAKELTTHHSVLNERPRYSDVPGFKRASMERAVLSVADLHWLRGRNDCMTCSLHALSDRLCSSQSKYTRIAWPSFRIRGDDGFDDELLYCILSLVNHANGIPNQLSRE